MARIGTGEIEKIFGVIAGYYKTCDALKIRTFCIQLVNCRSKILLIEFSYLPSTMV